MCQPLRLPRPRISWCMTSMRPLGDRDVDDRRAIAGGAAGGHRKPAASEGRGPPTDARWRGAFSYACVTVVMHSVGWPWSRRSTRTMWFGDVGDRIVDGHFGDRLAWPTSSQPFLERIARDRLQRLWSTRGRVVEHRAGVDRRERDLRSVDRHERPRPDHEHEMVPRSGIRWPRGAPARAPRWARRRHLVVQKREPFADAHAGQAPSQLPEVQRLLVADL